MPQMVIDSLDWFGVLGEFVRAGQDQPGDM
jgi:hypothetical protein